MISISKPSSHNLGDTIFWDDKEWLVCHYDQYKNQVYLISKDCIDICNSNAVLSQTPAIQYEKYCMSEEALSQCVPIMIHGIMSKVFIPSWKQLEKEFDWFKGDAETPNINRAANYQGVSSIYFLSTSQIIYNSASIDYGISAVNKKGQLGRVYTMYDKPYRVCVCVQL